MAKKNIAIFNETDGFFASDERFDEAGADKFIEDFPKRYEKQGYYRNSQMEKMDPKEVVLIKKYF